MCGIVGVISRNRDVVYDARTLLNAINNRGTQACGMTVFDGKRTRCHYGRGTVAKVFPKECKKWPKLVGSSCAGHCLYSTISPADAGEQPKTEQPVVFHRFHRCGRIGAVSHNGNLVGLDGLRKQAKQAGYKFRSETSDTEVIAALISISKKKDFLETVIEVLKKIEGKGAFSLVILFKDKLYGARDQNQIRPLCIAKKDGKNGDSDSYFFVSQSSAIPSLEATRWIREVQMGEVVVLGADGIDKSVRWTERTKSAFCICEPIYSLNPNDTFFGVSAYAFRVKAGEVAARKNRVRADCAVPVPESGRGYIDGFCSESGIPSRDGLIKSRYSLDGGRTFMEDRNVDRGKIQKRKLQANPDVMRGRVVLLVEDSIFRGSVAPASVKMSREHGGAREVHMVVCSPPVCFPCHLGLDTGTSEELVASHMSLSEIRDQKIHSDSLVYLSVAELKQVLKELGLNPDDFCFGCFTGKYPVPPPKRR